MRYSVYPPLGIARLGRKEAGYFLGPERPASPPFEVAGDGTETPVVDFKPADGGLLKRRGTRFWLFQHADADDPGKPAELAAGTKIRWTVRLVNKKDAVVRGDRPPPPQSPLRPAMAPGREDRVIDSGIVAVSGTDDKQELIGRYRTHSKDIVLGATHTDARQRLTVLGGLGISASPLENAPIGSDEGGDFYNNPGWFDDVSDGPVTATIVPAGGGAEIKAEPAWIVVGPPDFAPAVRGLVTMYDVLRQVALDANWLSLPARPAFYRDVRPLLERASSLHWVHKSTVWPKVSTDWAAMSDPSPGAAALRKENAERIRKAEAAFSHNDAPYAKFALQPWQGSMLDQWIAGDFEVDAPESGSAAPSARDLTRTVLDGTIAQPFFPGIEAGVIILDRTIYAQPFDFRISHAAVSAGDLTALMALPWQADFLKCAANWWPTQRPNATFLADGSRKEWLRPALSHRDLVDDVVRLGVVAESAGGTSMVETRRDPTL